MYLIRRCPEPNRTLPNRPTPTGAYPRARDIQKLLRALRKEGITKREPLRRGGAHCDLIGVSEPSPLPPNIKRFSKQFAFETPRFYQFYQIHNPKGG